MYWGVLRRQGSHKEKDHQHPRIRRKRKKQGEEKRGKLNQSRGQWSKLERFPSRAGKGSRKRTTPPISCHEGKIRAHRGRIQHPQLQRKGRDLSEFCGAVRPANRR